MKLKVELSLNTNSESMVAVSKVSLSREASCNVLRPVRRKAYLKWRKRTKRAYAKMADNRSQLERVLPKLAELEKLALANFKRMAQIKQLAGV